MIARNRVTKKSSGRIAGAFSHASNGALRREPR